MVRRVVREILTVCGVLAFAAIPQGVAQAQSTSTSARQADSIPKEYVPPAGMCRIWLDGVPAAQQPAPTDCSLAVRNKPPNGKIVYGPTKGGSGAKPPIKRFESKAKPPVKIPGISDVSKAGEEPRENKRVRDDQSFGDRQGNLPVSSSVGLGVDARYFSGNAALSDRGSANCLDRDGDGWCDDFGFGPPPCLDQDRDRRCDDLPGFASLPYPQQLPRMQSAIDVVQGRPTTDVAQWLGTSEFITRLPDQGRGTPWRAIFLDANTHQLLQVWTDRDKDGVVDRVEVFRDGQRVKLIQR